MQRLSRKLQVTLLSALILIASAGVVTFAIYLVGLDHEVRGRFAGARWALPAQVFATPLELYPGLQLPAIELQHELERLGYRGTGALAGPGTFVPRKNGVDIDVRAFAFWDGAQPELKLSVDSDAQKITAIQDVEAAAPRQLVRLDPMLIGSIYPQQGEDRVLVRLDQVPALLPDGLIAVEDRAFRSHFGISAKAIMRATFANLRAGHVVQGGSTITQQLVKNFFLDSAQTWGRKINEAFMALLLEAHYSKDEILEAYLNEVHLGQDGSRSVNGFGLGSQFYFNKPLSELRPHEVALLVGLVKGPSFYNPRKHPDRAKERRDVVLGVFHEEALLGDDDYNAALAEPLGLAGGSGGGSERYPAFVDLVRRQLRGQYHDEDLTNEGLRIFSTLDPRTQESLEKRIVEALPGLEKSKKLPEGTLESAGVVTSVDGGDVLAVVGGRDVRYAGFNRALDARRSIGSLAKPFVYLTALMRPERFNLQTILEDQPVDLKLPNGDTWAPRNYDKQLHGPQPLYMALAQSYNLPTVQLGMQMGEREVLKTLHAAGYSGPADPLPSLFLGAVEIEPLEVAQMYAALAAGGFSSPLSSIREVQTKEGQPLSRYSIKVRQALPEGPVYLLNWALRQVMIFGTGRAAYSILPSSVVVAGKTGTTDDYRDSWFAGFGGDRVGVIWVGRDDNQPTGLSGAAGALPIWAKVMKDIRVRGFDPVPPGDIEQQLTDPATGLRADAGCAGALDMPYLSGYAPRDFSPCADSGNKGPLDWLRDMFRR